MSSDRTGNPDQPDTAEQLDQILVRDRGNQESVALTDIRWIEAAGDYVVLHTQKKKHLLRATLAGMAKRLPSPRFLRIHRSSIVNVGFVQEVRSHLHGDYLVYLQGGEELRLSRRFWPKVESQFAALT